MDSTRKIISEPNTFRKESLFINIQQICVINHLLRVLDGDDRLNGHLIPPEVMTTEQDYTELWQSECKCDCEWKKSRQQRRCRSKFTVIRNFLFSYRFLFPFITATMFVSLRATSRFRSTKMIRSRTTIRIKWKMSINGEVHRMIRTMMTIFL